MYIENFWGGRGSSKYYHGYIEGGWGYKGPKNVLRSMWLIPNRVKKEDRVQRTAEDWMSADCGY